MHISDILAFLVAENISFTFAGNQDIPVTGFSSLAQYKTGTFTWVKKQESIPNEFDLKQITLAIVSEEVCGEFQNVIRTSNSKYAFFSTIEHFFAPQKVLPPVGQFTYISSQVKLGKNVRIGHNCTLDGDITVGDNTVIWNHVTIINRVTIGQNCEIQSGTVIGHDGFGYTEDSLHKKNMVRHFGGVIIGSNVSIGSNVCICRGTIDDTVIENGVKIDNLSHIAHNCCLEADVALAYPCKLGGSTHIGKNGYLAAATIRNQSDIGMDAFIGLGAVVVHDVEDGQIVVGNPARQFIKKG